jgi:hypothetical protein
MLIVRSAPQLLADGQALVARSRQDHGLAPIAFATATANNPIGPGPITTTLSPATKPPSSVKAVHRGAGGDDQRRLGVAHGVGHLRQRVDVDYGVFGESRRRW